MQSIHSAKWKCAIRKELRSLKDLGVFLELRDLKEIQQIAGVTNSTEIMDSIHVGVQDQDGRHFPSSHCFARIQVRTAAPQRDIVTNCIR